MATHQSYGTLPALWDHTVSYLQLDTGERVPPNPSQKDWYSIYVPQRDGRLSWWLVRHRDGLPTRRRSPVHVLTGSDVKQLYGNRQGFIYTPLGGVHPSHLKAIHWYNAAPTLGGSPRNHWILVHVCFKEIILFHISGVTFEVSSCTEFQIFRGSAPDPAGGAYSAPQAPSC